MENRVFINMECTNKQIKTTTSGLNSIGRVGLLLLMAVLSTGVLPGCSSSAVKMAERSSMSVSAVKPGDAAKPMAAPAQAQAKKDNISNFPEVARSLPQLIKKAELSLVVTSIDETMKSVTNIVQQQQGDLLGYQDSKYRDNANRYRASLQIRVPQDKLDNTLNALVKLGTVQNRSLVAEDVTDQLVDNDARLRNLRKAEDITLKMMERSGSVADILKVSQELSRIREQIERLDAQQKSLKNQVAYSTINLTLETAIPASPIPNQPVWLRIQETWGKATSSITELSLSLLEFSIWLFVFSPFLIIIAGSIYLYKRSKNQASLPGINKVIKDWQKPDAE